jgi:hypothetical protein
MSHGIICLFQGTNPDVDSYSAFFDNQKLSKTSLEDLIKKEDVTDLYICGIATDVCVGISALASTLCSTAPQPPRPSMDSSSASGRCWWRTPAGGSRRRTSATPLPRSGSSMAALCPPARWGEMAHTLLVAR